MLFIIVFVDMNYFMRIRWMKLKWFTFILKSARNEYNYLLKVSLHILKYHTIQCEMTSRYSSANEWTFYFWEYVKVIGEKINAITSPESIEKNIGWKTNGISRNLAVIHFCDMFDLQLLLILWSFICPLLLVNLLPQLSQWKFYKALRR